MPWRPSCLLVTLGSLLLVACGSQRRADELTTRPSESRVDVFLRAADPGGARVELRLGGLYLRDATGTRVELAAARPVVRSDEAGRRIELGGGPVEPGTYEALEVVLRGAAVEEGGTWRELRLLRPEEALETGEADPLAGLVPEALPGEVAYPVPLAFTLARQQGVSAFLEWDVQGSIVEGSGFVLRIVPSLARPQVRYSLLYLTDPSTGTLRIVDRRSREVVAIARVGQSPSGVAASRIGFTVFVANAGEGSVTFVDSRAYQTEITVPIRLGAGTSDIAVVAPSQTVAATNPLLDTVSLIDIPTSARMVDVRVGRQPTRLVALPELERVYTVNSGSDDVSVIDVRSGQVLATLPTEPVPTCLALNRLGTELYVAHRVSPNLLILDARAFTPIQSMFIGDGATAVIADRRRDRVYVARTNPPELVIVDRRQDAVLRRIPLSAPIENLVQPPDGPLLYGASPRARAVLTVDVILGRETDPIPCGVPVFDVAIAE